MLLEEKVKRKGKASFLNVYWKEKEFKEDTNNTAELVGNCRTEQLVPTPTRHSGRKLPFTLIEEDTLLNKEFCPENELEQEK